MAPAAGNADPTGILYGFHPIREALKAGTRPFQRILVLRTDRQFGELVQVAKAKRIPVHVEPLAALDRLVPNGKHQGVVAIVAAKSYSSAEEILGRARLRQEPALVVILDGVEDPHNLGAVLRTAEAAGVHGVFIPERRAAGLTSAVAKVSAGALDHILVARVTNLTRLLNELKDEGLWIYALDPSTRRPYTDVDMTGPLALVAGGENEGIRPGLLKECDASMRIPLIGKVKSLNVSAAVAVTLFETVRQRTVKALATGRASESESCHPE
ncbi:MAG TPA: 23S rRNA (guanosine(2251)-2'-O)-methyltransferase RlmB [Nitrospira sp.]|nr:23S rRNA (guanosine(2251)-2'-O)-methyltransferase RlmB [Nitrospira sp.]